MQDQPTLFDKPVIPITNKVESFYSKDVQSKRLTQKERILQAVQTLCRPSQNDISKATGIARHLIPDRVLTLIKENKLRIAGSKVDPVTNKEVTTYEELK